MDSQIIVLMMKFVYSQPIAIFTKLSNEIGTQWSTVNCINIHHFDACGGLPRETPFSMVTQF